MVDGINSAKGIQQQQAGHTIKKQDTQSKSRKVDRISKIQFLIIPELQLVLCLGVLQCLL